MTTMIERVARTLEPQAWRALGIGDTLAYKNRRTSSLRKARAAIEAMREPTDAMADEGYRAIAKGADAVWIAMIDAALKDE